MIWPVRSNAWLTRVAEAVGDRHRRVGLPGQAVERAEHQVLLVLAVGVQLRADLLPEASPRAARRRATASRCGTCAPGWSASRSRSRSQCGSGAPSSVRIWSPRRMPIWSAGLPGSTEKTNSSADRMPGLVVAVPGGVEHRHRDDDRRARLLDLDVRERDGRVAAAQVVEAQRRGAGAVDGLGELGPGRRPATPLTAVTKSKVLSPACAAGEAGIEHADLRQVKARRDADPADVLACAAAGPSRSISTGVTSRSSASGPRRIPKRSVLPAESAITRSSSSQ